MKILFTADLHLNIYRHHYRHRVTSGEQFALAVKYMKPDAVVIAGDICEPIGAEKHLQALRKAVGDRPMAICLGNHDYWLSESQHHEFPTLDRIVEAFWEKAARDADVVLLERQNAEWGEVTVVGGYGHFDLGQAVPNLAVHGVPVTENIYLAGGMNGIFWNDFRRIPNCAAALKDEARLQAVGLGQRLDQAISSGGRILVATHTCPWNELHGHPLGRNELDILAAYSGNSLVGKVLESRAAAIELAMCGHTHVPVRPLKLHGVKSFNVGTEYGVFRGVIYDTKSHRIRWIGEPVP